MSALCLSFDPPVASMGRDLSPLTRRVLDLIKLQPGVSKQQLEHCIQAQGGDSVAMVLRNLLDLDLIEMRLERGIRCYWPKAWEIPDLHKILNEMVRRSLKCR